MMKKLLLSTVILVTACSPNIPPVKVGKSEHKIDLARVIAEQVQDKPVLVVQADPPRRTFDLNGLTVTLCNTYDVGPYIGDALPATVDALNKNKQEIENCANAQLLKIAQKLNLKVK